jgi:hypothetical protein
MGVVVQLQLVAADDALRRVGEIDNRPNAAYSFNINPYPIAPGAKPSGIALGIAHFF